MNRAERRRLSRQAPLSIRAFAAAYRCPTASAKPHSRYLTGLVYGTSTSTTTRRARPIADTTSGAIKLSTKGHHVNLTREERETVRVFKHCVNAIKFGPDRRLVWHEGVSLELDVLGNMMLKVDMILARKNQLDDEGSSLAAMTDAAASLLDAARIDHDPTDLDAVAETWFEAQAGLVWTDDDWSR